MVGKELVEHEEENAGHEQTTEKPEGSGHKLIISAHGCQDSHQAVGGIVPCVGMRHAPCPVAVGLIENAEMMPHIVKHQEKETPFHKGDVKPLESFCAEAPGIGEIFVAEEIAGSDKEERHVEGVDEVGDQFRRLSMSGHHQNDGYPFGYRYGSVSTHDEDV